MISYVPIYLKNKPKHPIGSLSTSDNFDAMDKECDENLYIPNNSCEKHISMS